MIDFGIKDAIDILCVAYLLYNLYKMMKTSGSLNVFYGVLVFVVIWIAVSQVFEMKLLGSIFDKLVSVGVLALIILFQDEIRRFFLTIGSSSQFSFFRKLFTKKDNDKSGDANPDALRIVRACDAMSKNKIGALIIIQRRMSLRDIVSTGEIIDAQINTQLIKNIFFKNSPLHDGAMIISNNRIEAAACLLPVSHRTDIPKEMGLRHRAALGMTQQSDALAIIVSEENGKISIAEHGEFAVNVTQEELERMLTEIL